MCSKCKLIQKNRFQSKYSDMLIKIWTINTISFLPSDLSLKFTFVLLTKSEIDLVTALTNICELNLVSWISTQGAKTLSNANRINQEFSLW